LGAEEGDDVELGVPKGDVAGRCGGGDAGRGAWLIGAVGLGAIGGGAAGRGAGAGIMAGDFGAALRAAAFLRAGFARFAVLRFAAARPRFAPFLVRLPLRAAARVVRLDFARAPFLRPDRFDFDLDPVRAIKPPVSELNSLQ
jgi:hypothetical protein